MASSSKSSEEIEDTTRSSTTCEHESDTGEDADVSDQSSLNALLFSLDSRNLQNHAWLGKGRCSVTHQQA